MELTPDETPGPGTSTFPIAPGFASFACLASLVLWGGSSRAVTVAATWWATGRETDGRLIGASVLLAAGLGLAVLGVFRARRAPDPRLRRAAVGFHLVILLAALLAGLLGHVEARWADGPPVFGLEP